MKQTIIFTIITIVFGLKASCQMNTLFESEPFDKQNQLRDSISAALPGFTNEGLDSTFPIRSMYRIYFKDNENRSVVIQFYKVVKGVNKDLEIAGFPALRAVSIFGTYKPMFEIWKKYYDKDADMVKIQNAGFVMVSFGTEEKQKVIKFYKQDGTWIIQSN